ncbi:MAG: hypothetical protein KIG57_07495, partial [Muribaculaceae bacterium]|nr:hypothetical protein [Muribaculaceae bacterium]
VSSVSSVSGVSFRFWITKPPGFGPNPNNPGNPIGSSRCHIMAAENTQKGNPPTCGGRIPTCLRRHTRFCLASYSRSFCGDGFIFVARTKAGNHIRFK